MSKSYFFLNFDNSIVPKPILYTRIYNFLGPDNRRASDHWDLLVKDSLLGPIWRLEKLKKIEILIILKIRLELDPGDLRTFKTSKNDENCDLGPPKIEKNWNFDKFKENLKFQKLSSKMRLRRSRAPKILKFSMLTHVLGRGDP